MTTIRVAAVSMNGFLGRARASPAAIDVWCERAGQAERTGPVPRAGHPRPLHAEYLGAGRAGPRRPERAPARGDRQTPSAGPCAGLSEKERDIVFNTQVLVGPHGYIGKQRKLHLSRDEVFYYKGGREITVFDIGPCKVGIVICYDNQFPEVARVLALRGAEVILMPHAGRFKLWDDTPESQAAARRYSHNFLKKYALRARENACFAILADQVGRAGYVDLWPRDSENQPHHAGAALIWGPGRRAAGRHAGRTHPGRDDRGDARCRLAGAERALANYMLRTRRPELFGELVREQVSC